MTTVMKIDFVSDIACPWCAVGLGALEQALEELQNEVKADIHFQPFELNPHMPEGGEDLVEHLGKKYGSTAEQQSQMYQNIKARGEASEGIAICRHRGRPKPVRIPHRRRTAWPSVLAPRLRG